MEHWTPLSGCYFGYVAEREGGRVLPLILCLQFWLKFGERAVNVAVVISGKCTQTRLRVDSTLRQEVHSVLQNGIIQIGTQHVLEHVVVEVVVVCGALYCTLLAFTRAMGLFPF